MSQTDLAGETRSYRWAQPGPILVGCKRCSRTGCQDKGEGGGLCPKRSTFHSSQAATLHPLLPFLLAGDRCNFPTTTWGWKRGDFALQTGTLTMSYEHKTHQTIRPSRSESSIQTGSSSAGYHHTPFCLPTLLRPCHLHHLQEFTPPFLCL